MDKFKKKACAYLTDDSNRDKLPVEMHSQIAIVKVVVAKK